MRRILLAAALLSAVAATAAGAASAASADASCNGITASSAAGHPGDVAAFTRLVHQELKDLGLPPGAGDSTFAKLHAGSLEGCFTP